MRPCARTPISTRSKCLKRQSDSLDHWPEGPQREHFLVAAGRFLAAHSPTQRTQLQTAEVALRLHRGDELYQADSDSEAAQGTLY